MELRGEYILAYYVKKEGSKNITEIFKHPIMVAFNANSGKYIGVSTLYQAEAIVSSDGETYYFINESPIHEHYVVGMFEDDIYDEFKDSFVKGYTYLDHTGMRDDELPVMVVDIKSLQKDKQEENKTAFNNYLLAHPYEYNGKQYGTTLQDQLEINLMLSQAQAMAIDDEEPQVEWHATTEVNESMSVSDLLAIQAGIKNAVAAPYKKMQEYKKAIFDCDNPKELSEMTFEY